MTQIKFPVAIPKEEIERFLTQLKVEWSWLKTDSLHHIYAVSSRWPSEFVKIGIWIGKKIA